MKYKGSISKVEGRAKPFLARLPLKQKIKNGRLVGSKEVVGYFTTYDEALMALKRAYRRFVPHITIWDVYEALIQSRAKNNKSKLVTKDLNCYFKCFGDYYDNDISNFTEDILLDVLYKYGTTKPKTKKIRLVYSQIVNYARSLGLEVNSGPVIITSVSSLKKENKQYNNPFTDLEIEMMTKDDSQVSDIIKVMINTNIKIYTLLDLKKTDIDFEKKIIKGKSQDRFNDGILFDDNVAVIFKKYCDMTDDYLFKNHLGKRLEYSVFRRYNFLPLLEHFNIKGHSIKDLHATYLLKSKGD